MSVEPAKKRLSYVYQVNLNLVHDLINACA
jgi:hypothetical protein